VLINTPKFISPSALSQWRENQEQYYCRYLAVDRVDKQPQNKAMSVGSAFDAYVKSWLYQRIFNRKDEFDFDTIFTKQVEQQNRDFAIKAGAQCFIAYKQSGSLLEIFKLLEKATNVRFEFTATGQVEPETGLLYGVVKVPEQLKTNNPVVLLGKPDLNFVYHESNCTLDWKVNGFCSANGKTPTPGYVDCAGRMHKDCSLEYIKDMPVNRDHNIEIQEPSWATQIATYSWLTGSEVGSEFIALVDQVACKPGDIRIAKHRCRISKAFQEISYKAYQELWDCIHSGHIFKNMSREESEQRCDILSGRANVLNKDTTKHAWLKRVI